MPIAVLQKGIAQTITQNVAYALPTELVYIQSSAVVETSLDNSTYAAVSASTTGVLTAALFVRCTTANAIISCKQY